MAKLEAPPHDPRDEADQLDQALGDVVFHLTHDPADLRQDLRDAAAFAPIAAVKSVLHLLARPGRVLAAAGVLLLVAGALAALRRAR